MSAAGSAAVLAAAAAWLLIGGAAGSLGRLAGPSSSRFDVARGLAAVGARRRRRGADLPLVRQLPEALDLLAACLDAGGISRGAMLLREPGGAAWGALDGGTVAALATGKRRR